MFKEAGQGKRKMRATGEWDSEHYTHSTQNVWIILIMF